MKLRIEFHFYPLIVLSFLEVLFRTQKDTERYWQMQKEDSPWTTLTPKITKSTCTGHVVSCADDPGVPFSSSSLLISGPPMAPADPHSAHTCSDAPEHFLPHPSRRKRQTWIFFFFPGQFHFSYGMLHSLSQSWGRDRSWRKHSAANAVSFQKISLWEKAITCLRVPGRGWQGAGWRLGEFFAWVTKGLIAFALNS